jgi:hypothetical protein
MYPIVGAQAAVTEPVTPIAAYPLFPVSTHKFIVLSICTLGLYQLYWCYQQWKRISEARNEALSPFWRAFFAPLFGFSLFERIRVEARMAGVDVAWQPMLLGTMYLVLSVLSRLPDPWWLLTFASLLPLILVQRTSHRVNARQATITTEPSNEGYSKVNIATIVVGGLFLVLALLGTFLPDPESTEESMGPYASRRTPAALEARPSRS